MAEQSLRQHILNQRERSQAQNLYRRIAEMLASNQRFEVVRESARPQDVVWGLRGHTADEPFAGDDRRLLSLSWSLGDFELIHYKSSAAKLSPLLSSPELERFIAGLVEIAGPISHGKLADALRLRFNLGEMEQVPADAPALQLASDQSIEDDHLLHQQALAAVSELSHRQTKVLLGIRAETIKEDLAEDLGCSAATIANEEKRIRLIIERHSEGGAEARNLLRIVGDLLYEHSGDEQS